MSISVGRYTFAPWLRRGIADTIQQQDTLGADGGAVLERATVPVTVRVNTRDVPKTFPLLGPGDVIGINPDVVVRTEPRHWVNDFEPNYLAFVEFYDEDFLWRYTPARPAGERMRPWMALVVLEAEDSGVEGEFTVEERRLPLPVLSVKSTASLPPHDQLWAWGHVHINEGNADANAFERFLESLGEPDHPNADRIVSRLVCPRRLRPNRAYQAFVVPSFETGRLAGLGQDPAAVAAQQPAWTAGAGAVDLPIYHRWRFRTGEDEDFETLVKRLEPRAAGPRVGIRDMDGEQPGWGLTAGTDLGATAAPADKPTVVGLQGALMSPGALPRPQVLDPSRPFFAQLQAVLNLPAQLRASPATVDLPVVSPPIYGEHHAMRDVVDVQQEDWLDDLNRDPRLRVPAGFGTRVVQDHQENYAARAWTQVRKILEANRLIRLAGASMHIAAALQANLGARLAAAEKIAFYSPVLRKVLGSPTTLHHQMTGSTLPSVAVSGAFRRLARPRGPLARRLREADAAFSVQAVVEGLASGALSAAPPKPVSSDLVTDRGVAGALAPVAHVPWLRWLLSHLLLVLLVILALLVLLGLVTGAWTVFGPLIAAAGLAYAAMRRLRNRLTAGGVLLDPGVAAEAVAATPARPDFRLVETDPVGAPPASPDSQVTVQETATSSSPSAVRFTEVTTFTPGPAGSDSVEARDFRAAAEALGRRLDLTLDEPVRQPFDLDAAAAKLAVAVDPRKAYPRRVAAKVRFTFDPEWLLDPEHLVPAMAYPDFDDPMYEKLRDISSELLLPNIEEIRPNTITLLLTNPPFIEAYLAGLNVEFGKELLWREYPTDRRGSYFRQFWDVRGIIAAETGETPAQQAERGRDIIPLDRWTSTSRLGDHRNPSRPSGKQLVLTVRGDLLRKYPNTLIYAQRAHQNPAGGEHPVIASVTTEAEMQQEIRFPVFKAGVEPDIRFFGFDLNLEQARGDEDPQAPADDWGWYFVIQQLPGEPRFGMDVAFEPDQDPTTPITWDDLSWTRFPETQTFVSTATPPTGFTPAGPGESAGQWGEDAARMASILFQKPVMIAVHAREMLEDLDA